MEETDTPQLSGKGLELRSGDTWDEAPRRVRGLLVAINIPGYYSLPVRILALRAHSTPDLVENFDVRYLEWDNPKYAPDAPGKRIEDLLEVVAQLDPDILGFSMNIWNRDACIQVARGMKARKANVCVLVGGQEVTNSVQDYLQMVPAFDYLIDGEGELPFIDFLTAFDAATNQLVQPEAVSGLHFRKHGESAYTGTGRYLKHLDENGSIILADMVPANQKDKLGVLLESSRGCPNRCGFCFEGAKHEKLRVSSSQRLAREATYMAEKGSRYFHVMDPILCNSRVEKLAQLSETFKRLKQVHGQICISVETYADQITEAVAAHLSEFTMLDIGLQSTHPPTLAAIRRRFDPEKFVAGIERIRHYNNTLNIYLILGLPFETAASFFKGLFFAMACRPTQLFINELLLLNGTDLRRRAAEFEYHYDPEPPYTVHATNRFSTVDLKLLKMFSKNIEHRYNLNNCILSAPTPWRPTLNSFDREYQRIALGGPCEQNCPGCRLAGENRIKLDANQLVASIERRADGNVELVCGDAMPIERIVHAAAQARLAGAVRIKLTAPYSLYRSPQALEQLANAGIHYYCTYYDGDDPALGSAFKTSMQDFKTIRRRGIQSAGHHVHPHVEVAVISGRMSDAEQIQTAAALGADYAVLVGLAGFSDDPAGVAAASRNGLFAELIGSALRHRFAAALPPQATAALFADNDDQEHILAALGKLGLISAAAALRPCHMAG